MTRLLSILIAAGLIALGAAWLADHDGSLTLAVAGYEIRASAVFAAALLLAFMAVLFVLMRLAFLILGGPAKLGDFLASRRARNGYRALTRGLIAAAAGDAPEADEAARRGEELLGDPPLVLLLRAQAAQLSGDQMREEAAYRAMLDRPETEYLGVRGLFALSLRRHDQGQAISLAIRAHRLKPKAAEATEALLDLHIACGEWGEAQALLEHATREKIISPDSARDRAEALAAAKKAASTQSGEVETGSP